MKPERLAGVAVLTLTEDFCEPCNNTRTVTTTTVEPLNKGHLGTQAAVPYSEVVPYWEVRDKTVILCTFTASMMYKTHYGVIK